jgi:SAM-dependent methyltransferase
MDSSFVPFPEENVRHLLPTALKRVLGRCRRWFGPGFDYRTAYRRTDLDRDYWTIVGPASKEEFESLGHGKLQALIELGMGPNARVLDVGCGTGQLTEALVGYLSPEGLYFGTDLAREAVTFCQKRYRRPNFVFLQNEMTRIPLEGVRFDFIYLGSVFTHMYPAEIQAMLTDLKPLLDDNGLILADVFVSSRPGQFTGNRGMVTLNKARLLERFTATGLHFELHRSGTVSPGVERVIYRFAHRRPLGQPPLAAGPARAADAELATRR